MISSVGAARTARPSRETNDNRTEKEYRFILPTIPPGTVSFNTLLLHADPAGRPYNADNFGNTLKDIVKKEDVASFGPYQFNHVWAITFHSRLEKEKLLGKNWILVKDRKCMIFDPNKKEVEIKIHWIPTNVADDDISQAFRTFCSVKKWNGLGGGQRSLKDWKQQLG